MSDHVSPLKQSRSRRVLCRVQPPAHTPTSSLLSALMPMPLSPLPQLQPKASAAGGTARHSHTCSSAPGLPPGSPQQETGCLSPLRRVSAPAQAGLLQPIPTSGHFQAPSVFAFSPKHSFLSTRYIVYLTVLLTDCALTEHKLWEGRGFVCCVHCSSPHPVSDMWQSLGKDLDGRS